MITSLIIFHYHLLPGGVTQVISQSIQSILRHLPEIKRILVVTGREENVERVVNGLQRDHPALLSSSAKRLEWKIIPEFDYLSEETATARAYEKIKKRLSALSGESLWWIHNYHIGKNPIFTRALLEIADGGSQRILFHIHDFPECSRFDNLVFLRKHCPLPLYPELPNVRYCVINSRDKSILISAGMNEEHVSLLHDPVPPAELPVFNDEKAKNEVNIFGKSTGSLFHPDGKLILYPIRTIRRKNVLEAVLLTNLLCKKVNLIVTLPGVSSRERSYSDLVQSCFSRGLVPGLFGTGSISGAPGFHVLTGAADMILSSSIQEGFGYLFLNALQWRVPLVARYLDILQGIEEVFAGYPHSFYENISIPLSRKESQQIRKKYHSRLKTLEDIITPDIRVHLEKEIDELTGRETIDFSYLSPGHQLDVIQRAGDPDFRKETQILNKRVIDTVESLLETQWTGRSSPKIETIFGLEAFAAGVKTICDSFESTFHSAPLGGGRQEKIIRSFAVMKNIRLLYE